MSTLSLFHDHYYYAGNLILINEPNHHFNHYYYYKFLFFFLYYHLHIIEHYVHNFDTLKSIIIKKSLITIVILISINLYIQIHSQLIIISNKYRKFII
jgi:hypothetical protein